MFADYAKCFRRIVNIDDCVALQKDLDELYRGPIIGSLISIRRDVRLFHLLGIVILKRFFIR